MHAVRRALTTAGMAGFLLLAPAGSAWADPTPTPTPDPSATASPAASPDASPTASPDASPTEAPTPTDEPTSGCEQNPEICQSGGAPGTTTDCGQVADGGVSSPPPPGVICIAGGLNPGGVPQAPGEGAILDKDASAQLPRTGPAPLLPTAVVGMWLVLLGVVAGLAGRRRTDQLQGI